MCQLTMCAFSFLATLGLCCCTGLSLLAAIEGHSLISALILLIAMAALMAQHGL